MRTIIYIQYNKIYSENANGNEVTLQSAAKKEKYKA